ncbi:hypothetical protein [Microcystis phage Mvi-JY20]|uniref:Uncharacterized protein n=1 Tax=Microcystis phage Mvi-JY20 TaxID=3128146 RepID=A0AAX4QG09_9CAUD
MNTQKLLEEIKRKQKDLQESEVQLEHERKYLEERLEEFFGEDAQKYSIDQPRSIEKALKRLEARREAAKEELGSTKEELQKLWEALQEEQAGDD